MPILIANVCIPNVTGGVVTFGDTYYVSPKLNAKTATGSGTLNTGVYINTNTAISSTNTLDPDKNDQNNVGNA